MATTGHENEIVSVGGLKATLQKYKTDISDKKVSISANQGLTGTQKTNARENIGIVVVTEMPASPAADTIYIVK
jgi:hypothetical protein